MSDKFNSAFKVKTGTIKVGEDIHLSVPEAGALIVNMVDLGLYYGDGLNWLKVPIETEAVAVEAAHTINPLIADTPIPVPLLTSAFYVEGGAITVDDILGTITIVTPGIYVLNARFLFSSSVRDTDVKLTILNGLVEILDKDRFCPTAGVSYLSDSLTYLTFAGGEVLTGTLEADKDCDAGLGIELGLSLIP